ncbi:hypothetical protein ABC855_g4144 [[Candida] zeylanoides]
MSDEPQDPSATQSSPTVPASPVAKSAGPSKQSKKNKAKKAAKKAKQEAKRAQSYPEDHVSTDGSLDSRAADSLPTHAPSEGGRRNSILTSANDRLMQQPHDSAMDDVISKVARQSASLSNDFMRRESVVDTDASPQDRASTPTESLIEENQKQDNVNEKNKSGFTKAQFEAASEPLDSVGAKAGIQAGASRTDATHEDAHDDPLTLVSDLPTSKLQEYIPSQEVVENFEPRQDQLIMGTNTKSVDGPSTHTAELSRTASDERRLPWDTDNDAQSLPWKSDVETERPEPEATPVECATSKHSVTSTSNDEPHQDLPSTQNSKPHIASIQEDEEVDKPLDQVVKAPAQQATQRPFWEDSHTAEPLPWENEQDSSGKNGNSPLPWTSNDDSLKVTAEFKQEHCDTQNFIAEVPQSRELSPFTVTENTDETPVNDRGNNETEVRHERATAPHLPKASQAEDRTSKLDDIFGGMDDEVDDSFFSNMDKRDEATSLEPSKEVSLAFLDDDDLLFDDNTEQLKVDAAPKPQPSKRHNFYVPSSHQSTPAISASRLSQEASADADLALRLSEGKKKNDAYDFSMNLPTKVSHVPKKPLMKPSRLSSNVAYLVPKLNTGYGSVTNSLVVASVTNLIDHHESYATFPGPLSKALSKTKRKEVEKWLEANLAALGTSDPSKSANEVVLNQVLLALVQNSGDIGSPQFVRSVSTILNPNVNLRSGTPPSEVSSSQHHHVAPTAHKLDANGLSVVMGYLQGGKLEDALAFSIIKDDWAMALMIANMAGRERFQKVASDYARMTFPFQKSHSKVHHLMPIVLKAASGASTSVVQDFADVPSEAEWAIQHWREIVSLIYINGSQQSVSFCKEFGKFLGHYPSLSLARDVCFILAGVVMTGKNGVTNGTEDTFSILGGDTQMGSIYSECYEFALHLSPTPILPAHGFPHLLPVKVKFAQLLADYGLLSEAQKYCDFLGPQLKNANGSHPTLSREFQTLVMRITSTGDSSGWFGNKISKVNLDKMWGHLDKFIGGDESKPKGEQGVFSKFSPSVSRTASTLDVTALPANGNNPTTPYPPYKPMEGKFNPQTAQTPSTGRPMYPSHAPQAFSRTKSVSHSRTDSLEKDLAFAQNKLPGLASPSRGQYQGGQDSLERPQDHFSATMNKRQSFGSISTENFGNPDAIRAQNHSPSAQSDISLDYPPDFKGTSQVYGDFNVNPLPNTPEKKKDVDDQFVPPTIIETPEETNQEMLTSEKLADTGKPLSKSIPPPPPVTSKPSTARANSRVQSRAKNPYAPENTLKNHAGRQNKYGPPPGSVQSVPFVDDSSTNPSSNMFNYGGYQGATESQQQGDFAVTTEPKVANVDVSFDNDVSLAQDNDEPLNQTLGDSSYDGAPKPVSMFEPYQREIEDPLSVGFTKLGEFPVPGSPDYTTRPNSVIGGAGGYFSSRLSQSHQSALYQQYEVEDDTVKDYIPVVEEEEEEEDDEAVGKQRDAAAEARRIAEEASKEAEKVAEEKRHNTADAGGSWFGGWLGGKGDGKPKPIRAKLGQKNAFYYDEKLKKWINKDMPLEEQLKTSAPPPPPKKRTNMAAAGFPGGTVSENQPPTKAPPGGGLGISAIRGSQGSMGPSGGSANEGPKPPASISSSSSRIPTTASPSLATAGLDDLLSIGSPSVGSATGRKAKRGPKRGYVNVLNQDKPT